jgi:hypothetical protein
MIQGVEVHHLNQPTEADEVESIASQSSLIERPGSPSISA